MTGFCDRAWAATADLRRVIDELPFLAELADGTLAPEAFRHYLEQDALYLGGYARALALLAARAPDAPAAAFWAGSAQNCAVETQLHADLLGTDLLGTPDGAPVASPTCLAYTSYLVATAATAPYPAAAAAVLPCYWVYAHVGSRLAPVARSAADHPYRRWVATYDAAPFQEATATARRLTDAAARSAPDQEAAMLTAFAVATRYELEFWRAAHARESWAVPV
ncbi:thiaminase /4-amino-5-aminomethyl-2-methylpyrimidine deaminase [Blastococcus sp. DSM 46786]|uniref:TenA family protein n=1 Tax=Blastococcus sp. DSM 46786 TaxID=1798227 RepID=UPI0008D30B17|nr:TenA family protein [Blastococcus sp. DSM 46786]SEL23690.1 thiaminase /4-amino-5-aminomethyl-2-methylpyrimidine deaminase [Blastococcus sp. DSM 46786]